MKKLILFLSLFGLLSCKENTVLSPNVSKGNITSSDFYNNVLFIAGNNYQIQTSESGKFKALNNDTNGFSITESGLIKAVPNPRTNQKVEITWDDNSKLTFYIIFSTNSLISQQFLMGWKNIENLYKTDLKYAIVLRHADADIGVDGGSGLFEKLPPEWWKSCDSKLARQMNDQGKLRSAELGKVFINNKLPIGKIISSEFCRVKTTAELMNISLPVNLDSRLNHSYQGFKGPTIITAGEILLENKADKKSLLIASHLEILGNSLTFEWMATYLLRIEKDNNFTFQGTIPYSNWLLWNEIQNNK